MAIFKAITKQEALEECIINLAEDLKNRAKDISNDWNKHIESIELKTTLRQGEILKWEVSKNYLANFEEVE